MNKKYIVGVLVLIAVISAGYVVAAGKPSVTPPVSYVAGYTALIDGEGIYPGGNVRPASYDALAQAVAKPAKVNVIGASTAQLFYNELKGLDTTGTTWGDCAYGGKTAEIWANPNAKEWSSCDRDGITNPDVVVIKTGHGTSTSAQNDITALQAMVTNAYNRWPTLKQVYLIDEGWMGYYQGNEPSGFQHGTAIKSVIANRMTAGQKWVAWGTYLWANGLGSDKVVGGIAGRNDGLEWTVPDYQGDGLHQSIQGARKQVNLFFSSLRADPVASLWYKN